MARGLKGVVYQTGPDGETHAFPAGTTKAKLPKWVTVDDGAFEDLPGTEAQEEEPAPAQPITGDYDSHKAAELKSEIERRNAGRDDDHQVVVEGKGNKPDLVAALVADDAANAG